MIRKCFLDAIFMEQMEFGLDVVDNCFVLPCRAGSSGGAWMISVPLDGRITYSQPLGMIFRDYGDKVGWVFPEGWPTRN